MSSKSNYLDFTNLLCNITIFLFLKLMINTFWIHFKSRETLTNVIGFMSSKSNYPDFMNLLCTLPFFLFLK